MTDQLSINSYKTEFNRASACFNKSYMKHSKCNEGPEELQLEEMTQSSCIDELESYQQKYKTIEVESLKVNL